jgi:hypothetical protein
MSRQRTVTQIDAKATRLLSGSSRGLLVRWGEGRGVHYEPARKERAVARSGKPTPVSGSKPPDSARRAHGERKGRYYDAPPNNMGAPKSDMGTPKSAPIKPTRPSRRGRK